MEIFIQFLYNFLEGGLIIGTILFIIDLLRIYNPMLLPYFGFVSASLFLIQLFQYYYIRKKAPKYTEAFLFHSILGYFSIFILSILLYFLFFHISHNQIIILFFFMNILLWIFYFFFYTTYFNIN